MWSTRAPRLGLIYSAVLVLLSIAIPVCSYVAVVTDANIRGRIWNSIDGSQNWTLSVQTNNVLYNAYLLDLYHANSIGAYGNYQNYASNNSMRLANWMRPNDWANSSSMTLTPGSILAVQLWEVSYSDGTVRYLTDRPNGTFVQYNPNSFFAASDVAPSPVVSLFEAKSAVPVRSQTKLRSVEDTALHDTLADTDYVKRAVSDVLVRRNMWATAQRALFSTQTQSEAVDVASQNVFFNRTTRYLPESVVNAVSNAPAFVVANNEQRQAAADQLSSIVNNLRQRRSNTTRAAVPISRASPVLQSMDASQHSSSKVQLQAASQVGPAVNITALASLPTFDLITAVFITPSYGVAVGLIGQMAYTKMAGYWWEYTPSPTLYDIFTIDSLSCMALSTIGVPAATIATASSPTTPSEWSPTFFPKNIQPITLDNMQAQLCGAFWVMGGTVGLVWLSYDYRRTWVLSPLPGDSAHVNIYAAKVLNPYGRMILAGSGGTVFLAREQFSDPMSIWDVDNNFKYVNSSSAHNVTWQALTFSTFTNDWLTIAVGCGGSIVIAGRGSQILRSNDGGEFWTVLSPSISTAQFMTLPRVPRGPFASPDLPLPLWTTLDLVLKAQGKTPDQVLQLRRDFGDEDLSLLDYSTALEKQRLLTSKATDLIPTTTVDPIRRSAERASLLERAAAAAVSDLLNMSLSGADYWIAHFERAEYHANRIAIEDEENSRPVWQRALNWVHGHINTAKNRLLTSLGTGPLPDAPADVGHPPIGEGFTASSTRSEFSLRMEPVATVRAPQFVSISQTKHRFLSANATAAPPTYPTLVPAVPVQQPTQVFSSISLTATKSWGLLLAGSSMFETQDCGDTWYLMHLPIDAAVIGNVKPNLRSVSILEAPVFTVNSNLSVHAVYLSEGMIPFQHRVTNIGSTPLTVTCLNKTLAMDPPLGNPLIRLHKSSPYGIVDDVIPPGEFRDYIMVVNTTSYPVSAAGIFNTLYWAWLHNGPTAPSYTPMSIQFKVVLDPPHPYIPSWFEANQEEIMGLCAFIYAGLVLFFLIRRSNLWTAAFLRPDRFALHFGWLSSAYYVGLMVDTESEQRDREFEKLRAAATAEAKRRARDAQRRKQGLLTDANNITALVGLDPNRGALVTTGSSPTKSDGSEPSLADVNLDAIRVAVAPGVTAPERRASLLSLMDTFNPDPRVKLMERIRIVRAPAEYLQKLMERDPRAIDENGEVVDKHALARRLAERKIMIRRKNNMEVGATRGHRMLLNQDKDAEAEAAAITKAEQETLKAKHALELQQNQLALQYHGGNRPDSSERTSLLNRDESSEDDSEVDVQGDFVDMEMIMRQESQGIKSRRRTPAVPMLALNGSGPKKRPPQPITKAPAPPVPATKGRIQPNTAAKIEKELKMSARRPSSWREAAAANTNGLAIDMPGHAAPHAKPQTLKPAQPVSFPMPSSLLASTAQRPGMSMPSISQLAPQLMPSQQSVLSPTAAKPAARRTVSIAQQAIAALNAGQAKTAFDSDDDEPPPPSEFAPVGQRQSVTVPAGWLASQSSAMGLQRMATLAHGDSIPPAAAAAQQAAQAMRGGITSAGAMPSGNTPPVMHKINSLLKK